eukprot:155035-Chlamydomonas_euryale.AAC.2
MAARGADPRRGAPLLLLAAALLLGAVDAQRECTQRARRLHRGWRGQTGLVAGSPEAPSRAICMADFAGAGGPCLPSPHTAAATAGAAVAAATVRYCVGRGPAGGGVV